MNWFNSFSIMLIIIEVEHYESNYKFQSLSKQIYVENTVEKNTFWKDVTRYTISANEDESFVNEIAYMMVTLHRPGA